MKKTPMLLGAALVACLLSTAAFASSTRTSAVPQTTPTVVPVPLVIVHPTKLPLCYEGARVKLALTVDEQGVPRDIQAPGAPSDLRERLLSAVSQWRFTPAVKNGVPVSLRVVLPIKLVAES